MGIFGALTTAVSGLRAQSFALENVSGNIANSQTTAFKREDTSFVDLIPDEQPSKQLAGSVIANSRATNTVQGDIQSATISTFMAINGAGFFVVEKPATFSDNRPVFDGTNLYTRRGDFQPNKDGYLVNGAGYYLMGIPVDPTTGNLAGSVPQLLQFQNDFLPAQATTEIDYRANLASYPLTPKHDTNIPGSELLDPLDFISNPVAGSQQPAKLIGSGANILPDAVAAGAGTVTVTTGTTLSSLGVASTSETFTVNDGTNTTTYTYAAGDDISDVISAINGGSAAVTASVDTNGHLAIASNNYLDTITFGGTIAPKVGFLPGNDNFTPTNLLTQGIVSNGQQMVIDVTSVGSSQTINFGPSGVYTLNHGGATGSLLANLQGLSGVTGTVNTGNGNISLTATNLNDNIDLSGTASTQAFGLHTTSAIPAKQQVIANDLTAFLNESVGGGAVTAYDVSGSPVNIQLRWAKIDSATLGSGHTDKWNLFYQTDSNATGNNPAWLNAGTDFTFDPNGQMNPLVPNVTLSNLTVNGISLGDVQVVFGAGGVTQFADPNGNVQVNLLQQNGFPAGSLQQISVNDKGRVVGAYSNGRTLDLAQITLANFNGANYLKRIDGGAFEVTDESGPAILGAPGKIVGSSLEGSNTDIADEFTKLIVTQQAYSANTRVISTSNQMVQDLLNMLR
jgi:flagellar hook protein FlgE